MADWYIATTGSGSGDGSIGDPWDIATGMLARATVQPSDTVYLRGGVYQYPTRTGHINGMWPVSLLGTALGPIVIRPYQSEHVELDGGLENHVSDFPGHLIIRDLEVYVSENIGDDRISSGTDAVSLDRISGGLNFQDGTNLKFIHCFVHACTYNGIGFWGRLDGESEIYGCVIYDNGFQGTDRNHGHGIYGQNETPEDLHGSWKFIKNNIFIDNWSLNCQMYGSSGSRVNYVEFSNNLLACWNRTDDGRFLIGPDNTTGHDYIIDDNFQVGLPLTRSGGMKVGYGGAVDNVTAANNYVASSVNVFTGSTDVSFTDTFQWQNAWNKPRYHATGVLDYVEVDPPSTPQVRSWASTYDVNRIHLGVMAFQGETSYSWDPTGHLTNGDGYEIRNPRSFWGAPLVSGTYTSGTIALPLTGGSAAGTLPEHTVELDTFIVVKTADPDPETYVPSSGFMW